MTDYSVYLIVMRTVFFSRKICPKIACTVQSDTKQIDLGDVCILYHITQLYCAEADFKKLCGEADCAATIVQHIFFAKK